MRRFFPAPADISPRIAATATAATTAIASIAMGLSLSTARPTAAQDNPAPAVHEPNAPAEAPKKRHSVKKPAEATPLVPAQPAQGAAEPPAAAATEAAGGVDPLVVQLEKAGVKTCLPTITTMGNNTLPGVAGYARAANWQTKTPNDRLASVILGQSYPDTSPLPKAFAMLFGSPAGKSKCDGYSVQVIPTKDKCKDLQTKILIRGKKIGELSGIPFLNDVAGAQVMLLPSAGDGCVVIGVRIDYAE